MPEGHTLHRLARDIAAAFGGRRVAVSSPQGRFADSAALVDGAVVQGAEAAGKHLFVEVGDERVLHVHLGLIGSFDVHTAVTEVPPPVGQVRLRLVSHDRAGTSYADLRGAIVCELVTPGRRDEVIARLGPDPLRPDADPMRAWARISRSQRPIGDLLMDQAVLAGVGNVYRAEVLFRHRMHPLRPGRTLRVGQWRAMWDDLVVLMEEGVKTGTIDTVRPEHTPEVMGRPARDDDHGGEVYVYRRAGQACHVCGSLVRTELLAGRNLFWCAHCQPRFRSRAVQ
jgi:DNA-formamidopyrimidine glycosylase